jgi:hypothetical protein
VEKSTPFKTEKETAVGAEAGDIEAPTPTTLRERKKETTALKELTEPYQGAARDERT